MKLAILSVLCLIVSSQAAQAQKSLVQGVKEAKVVVKGAGGLAAVQPYAFIKFKLASCSKLPLSVATKEQEEAVNINGVKGVHRTLTVAVMIDELTFDCLGSTTDFEYSFQISSDFRSGTNVNLSNSLPVEYN